MHYNTSELYHASEMSLHQLRVTALWKQLKLSKNIVYFVVKVVSQTQCWLLFVHQVSQLLN